MNKSDKFIAEQFDINDINDEEWTMNKCKQFLRFIQENPTNTRIEKEKDDENHIFLPKYIKTVNENGKKFYEWKSSELDDIFEAIFQFLDKYYPDINKLRLQTKHDEKISEWEIKYPKLKKENSKREAKLQNDFIKDVNDKWLPGFKYLYEFEYQRADYKGDLIVANDLGILAVVETNIIGYFPWQKNKNVNKVEKQAINYRNILMEETKDNPEIITVIGSYFLDQCHSGNEERRGFPLDIDSKIWNAIKQVNESNKKSPGKFVVPTISGETLNDLKATEEQIVEDLDGLNLEDEKN
ncbi:hypothetical protein RhiirA5_377562 [Rhizophagus irregularis]|uniref:Uncharacterized protein n=1 Tax=Rhizophagus irregularis TaxID=588596 RepID=A0A2N0PIZ9_9GLOM|nr:hypothetical protein RhiirA5_377562 [Rhizophagus irregularis]